LAGNIGAVELVQSALRIEQAITGNESDALINVQLAQLESDLARIFAVIDERPVQEKVALHPVGELPPATKDSLAFGLNDLYTLLRTDDADAPRLLEQMAPRLAQYMKEEELERLIHLVTRYEFEAAAELLHGAALNFGLILK
jgi:hypothetical protein